MWPVRISMLRIACAASLLTAPLAAQETFTLDHLRKTVGVSSATLSPDGKTAVITVTRPNYTTDRNESELFAVDVATGTSRQLTFARRVVAGARFAPGGKTLSFLSPDSAGRMQLWLMPMGGGDTRRLTAHPEGVNHYSWRPDGRAIAFAASDERPRREGEERFLTTMTIGAQDIFLRSPIQPEHIWMADIETGATKRLTKGNWSLEFALPPSSAPSALSWSPDGRTIAFAEVVAPESGKLDSVRVMLLDVASGAIRPLTSARRFENNPVFSRDGKLVAYWHPRDGRGDLTYENEVWVAPLDGGAPRSLTTALDRNLFGAQWMPDGRSLLVAGNDRTGVGVWIQPIDGSARQLDLGELVVNGSFGYDITVADESGTIAFVATSPTRPAELYVMASPDAKPRRLTDFNAWATQVAWGKLERVTWKTDAFEADGVLAYPPDFSPTKKYPLVLVIHGGPQSSSKVNYSALPQLMAAEGWIVFQPNYRGSDNLGNKYLTAIVGDAGAGPGRDVMAGVAMLRKRPYIDAAKTAVTGWSYGGFMTSWLIGNYPNEWKAAMAGAPVTDWEDQYNLSDGGIGWRYMLGGSPWTEDRMKKYREQSPITYATRIKTPTRVMTNMEDFRVPPSQAFALYRAMKDNGVETDFIGFGGRTHNSSDPVNVRERTRLWIEWVKRYINEPRVVQ